uniref:Uncharacterized protein n=1 Tax=Triticum urartu TaxID=4572 RepID=A0A8R7PSA5_TRIUA
MYERTYTSGGRRTVIVVIVVVAVRLGLPMPPAAPGVTRRGVNGVGGNAAVLDDVAHGLGRRRHEKLSLSMQANHKLGVWTQAVAASLS